MTVDSEVHLTASANKPLAGSMTMEIHSLTATGNSEVTSCVTGTTCSVVTTPSENQTTYVAIITPNNSIKTIPSTIMAVSATLTPPAWSISITQTITTVVSLTATTNYKLDSLKTRYLRFYDLATGKAVRFTSSWCAVGTTCALTGFVPTAVDTRYRAFITADIPQSPPTTGYLAASDTVTPPPWTISLESSGNVLTARTNYDTSATGNQWMTFYDLSKSPAAYFNYLKYCNTGTMCTATVPTLQIGHQFVATAGTITSTFPPNPMLAISNQAGLQGPTSPYETAGGSNPAQLNDCYSCAGDPINTSNGEFFETENDITVPGRGVGLKASRTYSSQRTGFDGRFGFGWADPYGMAATELPDGAVHILQENGSHLVFTSAGSGLYTAPTHVMAKLQKNTDGTWTFTRRNKEIFVFGTTGRLTGISDLNGNTTTLTWDSTGKLTSAADGSGRSLTFTYGSNGKVATATDPASRVVSYSYDAAGRLQTVTLPGNRTTTYTYDAANLLTSITNPRGSVTVNVYDAARRVTKQTTAAGDLLLSYGADSGDALTTITSPGGRVTKETYRAGQLIKRVVGAGTAQEATWTYTYDPTTFANTSVKDPLNRTTSATYDARGNKLTTTDAGGGTTTATYDSLDNLLTSTNPAGTTTTYTYDATGNRQTASTPLTGTGQAAAIAYTFGDASHPGDLTGVTDPNGHTTTFAYDTNGNRTSITDPLGRAATTAYDVLGRVTVTTTPSGKTTTIAYSAAGFPVTVTDPLGKITTTNYDAGGNKTSVTDPMGRTTTYTYDALGRKTSTTAADNTVTATAYDADGNTTSQTDQAAHVTNYAYDSRNRLTSSTDGLNRSTTYSYDAAGQLTGKTDPSNRTATFTYNSAGDKTATSYSDGLTPNETFTYTSLHQLATMTDGTGTTTNTYDSLGRIKSRTNGAGKNIAFAYDLAGNVTAQTYPNGQIVNRAYDAANNLISMTDWLNNTTSFTTTADSRPATTGYANGITSTSTYNDNGLVTGIDVTSTSGPVATFGYTRNDNGNVTTAATNGITQPAEAYTYTDRDELASINTTAYGYDAAGNPTTLANGATLTYDAANQSTLYTFGGTSTAITYDNQGNRLTGPSPTLGTSTYAWNQANRLTSANGTAFGYDATGLRSSRTPASGPSQAFTWDTTQSVPLMLTDGALSYIYDAAGNPVEHIDASGTVTYYQHDQYGSTRLLTDSTGSTTATLTFDANGRMTAKTGSGDTVLRWNGQCQDADTGLYYLRNRYYDPTTTQFLSVDPLRGMTLNPYGYAGSNPLANSDPLGLDWQHDTADVLSAMALGSSVVGTTSSVILVGCAARMAFHCSAAVGIVGEISALATLGLDTSKMMLTGDWDATALALDGLSVATVGLGQGVKVGYSLGKMSELDKAAWLTGIDNFGGMLGIGSLSREIQKGGIPCLPSGTGRDANDLKRLGGR